MANTSRFSTGSGSNSIVLPPVITLKLDEVQVGGTGRDGGVLNLETRTDLDGSQPESQFEVEKLSDDLFAFRSKHNNKYWSAISGGSDGMFICASKTQIDDWCKFKVILGEGNKIALLPYYFILNNWDWHFLCVYWCRNIKNVAANIRSLNKYSLMEVGEPILKKEIIGIQYDVDAFEKTDVTPEVALRTTVQNSGSESVTQTLTYEYTKSVEGTWNNSAGLEIGVAATFKAGVPLLAETEIEVSTTASYSHEWGGSSSTEKKISSSTQVVVPARSKGKAKVIIKKCLISVPFSYTERRTYLNGKTEDVIVKTGVYENVEAYDVDVQTYDFVSYG
jgi:Clostridium epsilon toxin ETX/Bacillus mosquitocidal toxin MTX2.